MRLMLVFPLVLMGCSLFSGKFDRDGNRQQEVISSRGTVCGDPDLKGEPVGVVEGPIEGCGMAQGVRLRQIGNIALSQASVMECNTALTLKRWVNEGLSRYIGNRGGGVTSLKVASHYACRTRNSQKGARLSEHAKGRAIDIAAIRLEDGTEISVLKDWGKGRNGRVLRKLHKAACGPFGTVLGPDSDRHHKDHFHFDTASYSSGPYCR